MSMSVFFQEKKNRKNTNTFPFKKVSILKLLLRVFDLTANKFVYALIAESLSTLQAADTSQALAF